ncbi:MAG: DNA polymerase III subunit gamma/tau, partial [Chlamydiota bacterium]
MKKYQVLARRYRPQTFRDVVGQEAIITTLKNAIRLQKVSHAYLFSGSRGIGKTTLVRIFAKALNCKNLTKDQEPCNECSSCQEISSSRSLDVIEIDGASNRGIDDIRQINETICYAASSGNYKIYIIDEVHMLTKEAFNALLKTLEEPPPMSKFFFATTEPHKVLPTIISRCQRFDLARIPQEKIMQKLDFIVQDLQREVQSEALHLIARLSEGSLRDAESLLDQILCYEEGTVTAEMIRKTLGFLPQDYFFYLDQAIQTANTAFAFECAAHIFQSGKHLAYFLEELIEHYRHLLLAKIGEDKKRFHLYEA